MSYSLPVIQPDIKERSNIIVYIGKELRRSQMWNVYYTNSRYFLFDLVLEVLEGYLDQCRISCSIIWTTEPYRRKTRVSPHNTLPKQKPQGDTGGWGGTGARPARPQRRETTGGKRKERKVSLALGAVPQINMK
ncbi:hypothetical protein EVAR_97904_1 [Eumeta japonica]|uniref:Uncharacterized protein n=1 Tax=Eumeta variegata TaxID=151549 RepID=A0A4C1WDY2_EUMVA|nr:hypothetical protein EVAR_97904_1 [Eumeta japonica]